ncbi:hypothetical protein D9M72_593290 [compost metagenome]
MVVLSAVNSREARTAVPISAIESNRTLRLAMGFVMIVFLVFSVVSVARHASAHRVGINAG